MERWNAKRPIFKLLETNNINESIVKIFRVIFFSFLLLQIIGCNKKENTGKFIEGECPLNLPPEVLESDKFFYGHMDVPAFFDDPGKGTFRLTLAIFRCKQDSAILDPLVLCSGGPGLSNIDDFVPALAGGLGNLFLNNRDVIIIETRGLKYSEPFLHIPGIEKLQLSLLDQNLSVEETHKMYLDTLQLTYKNLSKQGINLSAFNTYEISNEIAYVMQQLGYEKFSFFGTSYGTEIAQYLLINHTDRMTSVVMNGVMDITMGGHHMHTSLIHTLDTLFENLQHHPEYSKAYPDLKNRFLLKITELNEIPDTVNIKYSKNQEEYKVLLNGNRVALWIFHQMYSNTQIQLAINKIINGDYSDIIDYPGLIFPIPEFSTGLSLSVFLSETKNIRQESIPLETEYSDLIKGSTLSLFGPYFLKKADNVWMVNELKAPEMIETDVPILLLSGKMDYLCRPAYAKQLAAKQKYSYLYIFEDVVHSPVDRGECAIMMLKEFFDNPNKAPNSACMDEYKHKLILP